jgi:murein DD-endopeptidase MepM/ murein hydrolase activator NlpD
MGGSFGLPVLYRRKISRILNQSRFSIKLSKLAIVVLLASLAGCERPAPVVEIQPLEVTDPATAVLVPEQTETQGESEEEPTPQVDPTPTLKPSYAGTPTPDPTHEVSDENSAFFLNHIVAFGETLFYIANLYNSSVEELQEINSLEDNDILAAGQELKVPGGLIEFTSSLKLIPDSELVYGPAAFDFDSKSFIENQAGYLSSYLEEVEGQELTGAQIVQLVADRFSVNPRLLLAILEHRSRWLTLSNPQDDGFPMGFMEEGYEGLYQQLSWAANKVNLGYYGRSEGGIDFINLDEVRYLFAPDINDATAGLQLLYASYPEFSIDQWQRDIGRSGLYNTYSRLFGNPFSYTVDPLWPFDLEQPPLLLPFVTGDTWYFTGGPHGGWASGSGWAALDFSPSDGKSTCETSQYWVVAVADGVIARSDHGATVLDLDGDGYAGTGWAITYMHIAKEDQIPVGSVVEAGDVIGRPSCEGGFSNATHLHISRTYNGRWVSADGDIPFSMGGWVSQGLNREYDGLLIRGEEIKEACECEEEGNEITGD